MQCYLFSLSTLYLEYIAMDLSRCMDVNVDKSTARKLTHPRPGRHPTINSKDSGTFL